MKKLLTSVLILSIFNIASAFDMDQIQIHGFASTGYLKSDDNNYLTSSQQGSFEFNEAGINFTALLTDDIRIAMQLYSYDLGELGNNNIKLDWCFLDYVWKDEIGFRIGKIKLPLGLYNEERDYDMLRTSIILPGGAYNWLRREVEVGTQGGSVYGYISLNSGGSLGYDAFAGTLSIDPDSGFKKSVPRSDFLITSGEIKYVYGTRLKWLTPVRGLMLAFSTCQLNSAYKGVSSNNQIKFKIDSPDFMRSYLSMEYNHGRLTLAGEYYRITGTQKIKLDLSALSLPEQSVKDSYHGESYYVTASYRLSKWFESGVYYSVFYDDKHDHEGKKFVSIGMPDYLGYQKELVVSTRFDITDFWLVKLEVHFIDGVGLCAVSDNLKGFGDENWMLYAFKTTFSF